MFKPIVKRYPHVVSGTMDTIFKLEQCCFVNTQARLVAADVTSLYTNIDTTLGVARVRSLLRAHVTPDEANFLADLLEWVLRNNYFEFNGQLYHQIKGTAMGTPCAPMYANLFLISYEEECRKLKPRTWPLKYFRFIDDIFFIVRDDDYSSEKRFFDWFNQESKAGLQLNLTERTTPTNRDVVFLDLKIRIDTRMERNGKFSYCCYNKPSNPHLYTHPSSYHPPHQAFSWLRGENIRLLRNSSSIQDFKESIDSFKDFLRKREYPEHVIQAQVCIPYEDRPAFLWPTTSKPKPNAAFVMVRNIPGRDVLERYFKSLVNIFHGHKNGSHSLTRRIILVIQRGENLFLATREPYMSVLSTCRVPTDGAVTVQTAPPVVDKPPITSLLPLARVSEETSPPAPEASECPIAPASQLLSSKRPRRA